jgi:putative ABC transport system permease protein
VKAAAPVQTLVNSQGGVDIVYGVDLEKFNAVSGGFNWIEGRPFQEPNEIIVDDWFARAKKAKVGGEVELLNQKFVVSGIVENGKGARIFMSLKTAQDLTGAKDRASMFYVKVDDPEQTSAVIGRMAGVFKDYPARPMREFASLMTSTKMPALDAFISSVVFVAACIGVLVIFLSMYTTITERTREIGILRALGASKRFIVTLIFQESVLVCAIGVVIGVGASFMIANLVKLVYPTLVVMITNEWIVRACIFAVLSGIVGSLYPSIKAAAQDPVEALAYE